MDKRRKSSVVSGLSLIVIGLGLFWLNRVEDIGESVIFFVVGSLFLGAYLYSKSYGLLIPGCLLLGLGSGTLLRRLNQLDDPWQIGLGLGFIGIFVIALLVEKKSHWWPLIPGGVLLVSAFSLGEQLMRFLFDGGWPLALVAVGVIVLLGAFTNRGSRKDPA